MMQPVSASDPAIDSALLDGPPIILDLSRLMARVLHPTPTGVDRVEMAYARGLLDTVPHRLHFAGVHPVAGYGRLPTAAVKRFLDATSRRWTAEGQLPADNQRLFAARALAALRPRLPAPAPLAAERPVYVQASPHHLTKPALVAKILHRERARFICLVHDLIPMEYPEYARPDGAAEHQIRVDTMVRFCDGILANSAATLATIRPWIARVGRSPHTAIAHLGIEDHRDARQAVPPPAGRPYFVCIGTIEPRKNHLLLLNIWRRLATLHGAEAIPKLILIGRRGWENEQIVDMLDRCTALKGCVEEYAGLPDNEMWRLLSGARALLMPSFAEGYGMPVTEALSLGVPVLCSDIDALREAGGDAPDYLDPIDGAGWLRAILAYAPDPSPPRTAQLARMAAWQQPSWQNHMAILLQLARDISR